MIDVAVVTSHPAASPERETETHLLLAALSDRGLQAARADAGPGPSPTDLPDARALLPWSIEEDRARAPEFQDWLAHAAKERALIGGLEAARLEADKRYLARLDAAEVPTVPTLWCRSGTSSIPYLVDRVDWPTFVLKSAAGGGLLRFERDEAERAQAHLDALDDEALLQPHLSQIAVEGVLGLCFVAGEFVHALRMYPRQEGAWRTDSRGGTRYEIDRPDGSQLEVGQMAAHELAPEAALLRVDIVRDIDGPPSVLQVRTVGPRFGLELNTGAARRIAERVAHSLGQ